MPLPDIGFGQDAVLRRLERSPLALGLFGWPDSMRYLVNVGYVRIFYDWSDNKTKAELTDAGLAHVHRERASERVYLTAYGGGGSNP